MNCQTGAHKYPEKPDWLPQLHPEIQPSHSSSLYSPFISLAAALDLLRVTRIPSPAHACTHARTPHFHADYIHFYVCCTRRKATVAVTLPQPSFLFFSHVRTHENWRAEGSPPKGWLMASLGTNICTNSSGGCFRSPAQSLFFF